MQEYFILKNEMDAIKLMYELDPGCCISFIIADDKEVQEYIKASISSIDTKQIQDERIINYNFYENLENTKENIKQFQNLCQEKGNLVIASGIGKYAEYLEKNGEISNKESFYLTMFNLPRDNFYLKNNVKLVLLVNESEMKTFKSEAADDFTSYASMIIDANKILREDNMQVQDIDER